MLCQIAILMVIMNAAFCGQVNYRKSSVDFAHFGLAQTLEFTFQLETSLAADSYIRIISPFDLDNGGTVTCSWNVFAQSICDMDYPISHNPCTIARSVLSADSGIQAYFLKLYDPMLVSTPISFDTTTWYNVMVKMGNPILAFGATQDPFQLYSTSSNLANFIVYDENEVFTSFHFDNTISASGSLVSIQTGTLTQILNSVLSLDFRLVPSIAGAYTIKLKLTNHQFKFTDVQNSCAFLDYNSFSSFLGCSTVDDQNIVIKLSKALDTSLTYRFSVKIRYPAYTGTSQITVYTLDQYTNTLVQYQTPVNVFTAAADVWKYMYFNFAWGMDGVLQTHTVFGIYRNPSASGEYLYNTVKIYFQPTTTMQSDTKYQVWLKLGSTGRGLENSILNNFVNFNRTSVVTCALTDSNTIVKCSNVYYLNSDTVYYISIKVSFDYDAGGSSTFPVDFGKVSAYPFDSYANQYSTQSSVVENKPTILALIKNSLPRVYIADESTNKHGVYNPSTTRQLEYQGANSWQTIEFGLKVQGSDFWSSYSHSLVYAIDIWVNSDILVPKPSYTYDQSDCYHNQIGNGWNANKAVCKAGANNLQLGKYATFMRQGWIDSDYCCWGWHSVNSWAWDASGTYKSFGFQNMHVKRYTSILSDDSFDVFVCGGGYSIVDSSTISTTSYQTCYMFNSFIIAPASVVDSILQLNLVNYWNTNTGSVPITGDQFPSLIRLSGYLTAAQVATVKKILIYFDYVNPFPSIDSVGPTSCTTTLPRAVCKLTNGNQNGYQFYYLPRVEIDVDLTGVSSSYPLQILIPVSTVINQLYVRLCASIVDANYGILGHTVIEKYDFSTYNSGLQKCLRQDMGAWQFCENVQKMNFQAQYYRQFGARLFLNTSMSPKVGTIIQTNFQVSMLDGGSTWSQNSGINQGAFFGYTAKWNFYASNLFSISRGTMQTASSADSCVKFAYLYAADTNFPVRYNVFCAISGTVGSDSSSMFSLYNFTIPFIKGTTMPSAFGTISNSFGYLMKYEEDITTNLKPNVITLPSIYGVSTDLPINSISLKVVFTFTTTNNITKDGNIFITSTRSFNFQVNTQIACRIFYSSGTILPLTSCTQTFFNNKIIATLSYTSMLSAGTYKLEIGGINVIGNPITSQDYSISTLDNKLNFIDTTVVPEKIFYNFNEFFMKLVISEPSFLINHPLARNIFSMKFQVVNRQIYYDEFLQFDFDLLNEDNQDYGSQLYCSIKNLDNTISTQWSTCKFVNGGNFKAIQLVPITDILPSSQFIIEIHQIKTPKTPIQYKIQAVLLNLAGVQIFAAEPVYLPARNPTLLMDFSQILFYKKSYNSRGSQGSIEFLIKPMAQSLNFYSSIVIYFPSYYSPAFSEFEPYCKVKDVYCGCDFKHPRILKLFDLPSILPVGQSFLVAIYGVPMPKFTSILNFFIALDSDQDESTVLEYSEVPDKLVSTQDIQPLRITSLSIQDQAWIQLTSYVIVFKPISSNIGAGTSIQLNFPKEWAEKSLWRTEMQCQLDGTPIVCTFQGNQISLISPQSYVSDSSHSISLQAFRNPQNNLCITQGINMAIGSSDEQTITMRSYPVLQNIQNARFAKNDNIETYFKWERVTSQQNSITLEYENTVSQIADNSFSICKGTYSPLLRLSTANDKRVRFDINLRLAATPNGLVFFQLFPENAIFKIGSYNVDLRIGVLPSTQAGTYKVYWNIFDASHAFYIMPPCLTITVLPDKASLPVPQLSQIDVPMLGTSLPIIINLFNNPPFSQLTVSTTIPISPELRLDYKTTSEYIFTVDKPIQYIQVKSNQVPLVSDRSTKLTFSVDSAYFYLPYSVLPVNLNNGLAIAPTVQCYLQQSYIQSTQAQIQVISNQNTQIFAQISLEQDVLKSKILHDFNETFNNITAQTIYSYKDLLQRQYITDQINLVNTIKNFKISNLLSNKTYNATLWFVNGNSYQAPPQSFVFTTKYNSGSIIKMNLTINATLVPQQISVLQCLLCEIFGYPYDKIMTINRIACNQTLTPAITGIPKASTTLTQFDFYFLPFDSQEVIQKLGTTSETEDLTKDITQIYLDTLNQNLTNYGYPILNSFQFSSIVEINDPVFVNKGNITYENSFITISGIELQKNGFVFAVGQILAINLKGKVQYVQDPSFFQAYQKLNNSDLPALSSATGTFVKGKPLTLSFSNITEKMYYKFNLYATSEDPSQFMIYSNKSETLEIFTMKGNILRLQWLTFILVIILGMK